MNTINKTNLKIPLSNINNEQIYISKSAEGLKACLTLTDMTEHFKL